MLKKLTLVTYSGIRIPLNYLQCSSDSHFSQEDKALMPALKIVCTEETPFILNHFISLQSLYVKEFVIKLSRQLLCGEVEFLKKFLCLMKQEDPDSQNGRMGAVTWVVDLRLIHDPLKSSTAEGNGVPVTKREVILQNSQQTM